MMTEMLMILLIIPLLGCLFALLAKQNDNNAYYISLLTMVSNILVVIGLLSQMEKTAQTFQFMWQDNITLTFGTDILNMLFLLSIYISVFIGLRCLTEYQRKNKLLMLMSIYFIWCMTGLVMARDILSFYIFFAGMLLPAFMLLGAYGNIKKTSMLYLFFIFNFAGILCLLAGLVLTYKFYHGDVLLENIVLTEMPRHIGMTVWIGVSLAFIIRIPIWPFHYWISSISAAIKNPVAYIITNMFPLSGVWGFMCFWNTEIPSEIKMIVPLIAVFGTLTMIFIALIGLAHKDFMRKLFSYSTIYYLFFLLSIVILEEKYRTNMIYSLFTFMIVNSSLIVLDLIADKICEEEHCHYHGILLHMPKLSRLFAFFVFMAAGLPISSMFWNNFMLLSALFRRSFMIGVCCVSAITMIGMALLYELYLMYDIVGHTAERGSVEDISDRKQAVFIGIIIILCLSFFDPLWFVF